MNFDEKGLLQPNEIIEMNLEDFEVFFIENLEDSNVRNNIFKMYKLYLAELKNLVGNQFFQLINGSFITQKKQPNDIDFVSFLDYRIYNQKSKAIEMMGEKWKSNPNLDAYVLPTSQSGHPYFIHAQLIFEYWTNLFG